MLGCKENTKFIMQTQTKLLNENELKQKDPSSEFKKSLYDSNHKPFNQCDPIPKQVNLLHVLILSPIILKDTSTAGCLVRGERRERRPLQHS